MADIVYTIVYGPGAFQFPKPQILAIGGPDRIGFVTTQETLQYLKGQPVALQRDGTDADPRDPFDGQGKPGGMERLYIVPVSLGDVKLFPVKRPGERRAFHLTCGHIDADGKFIPWTDAAGRPQPSVPVP